jgi:uncharacterized membrane protein YsdA (DUF1294 family)
MPFLILIAVNILAFALFALDKQIARNGGWRVPEGSLLLLVALGGGFGGYAAMQKFRHKTKKGSFRFAFWGALLFSVVLWSAISFAPNGAMW